MQVHADFIFHLEEPREQFRSGQQRVRGWVAAQDPVKELRLRGAGERLLELQERADVRRAFPNFASAIGFIGVIDARDVRNGCVHFAFGGRNVTEQLPPAPQTLSFSRLLSAKARRAIQRLRLRRARDARTRWAAALGVFLLDIDITRGGNFRRREADDLIALFATHFPEATVLQIGANDGVSGDPLVEAFARTRWSGVLVEPVPYLCDQLAARYAERPTVQIVQAAISARDGEAPLYRLRVVPGETPEWFGHLASLDRDVLLKQRGSIPDLETRIVEERTPTLRVETLLRRYKTERIDLLVIDTEGHDFEILREFDFTRFRPLLLMFEHQHLSAADKAAAYALLQTHGYSHREMPEGDAIAWRE